jgi:heat shock protein HslJ
MRGLRRHVAMHHPRRLRAHRPLRKLLSLVGSLAILLAACGGSGSSPTPTSPAGSPLDLEGTTWRATLIRDTSPLAGAEPTIRFEGGQAGGTTGCNTYGGAYHLDGGSFRMDAMTMTEMACDGIRGTQESVVIELLSKADRLEFLADGKIRISGPTGSITFAEDPR